MNASLTELQEVINTGDFTHDEISTLFDITVQQVDLVWLDMINNLQRQKREPLFTLG